MAAPQKENGYTPVANEIIENVIGTQFPATHLKIILMCWRYTYGFNRKEAKLSEKYVSKATGISKRYVSSAMKDLIDAKVLLVVKEPDYTSPRIIKFNKDYDQWECRNAIQQVKCRSTGESQNSTTDEVQFNTTDEVQFNQERNKTKLKTKSEKFSTDTIEYILSGRLRDGIKKNFPKTRLPGNSDLHKWAVHIGYMIRLDKREPKDIERVIDFALQDSFWQQNILSTEKLRKQFDKLEIKAASLHKQQTQKCNEEKIRW